MEFEWDPAKSEKNLAKHGVDFETAKQLFEDPDLIELRLSYQAEPRWAVVGMMHGKHWTGIITKRNGNIRIISVRRSHPKEEMVYEDSKE